MEKIKMLGIKFIVFLLTLLMMAPLVLAQNPFRGEKMPSVGEWLREKNMHDDPRPFLKEAGNPKNYLPPEMYKKFTFDVEAMKKTWTEVVGFKAPDEVGKIAQEIKPGTYSYTDKNKYPFKELMISSHYDRFKPGGPPHVGNFPEIKVVPTRQYYWALPIAEATIKNIGRTKLDDKGFFIPDSYVTGFPFPKPSGKFRAQQIVYNWVKRYLDGENLIGLTAVNGYDKKLTKDWDTTLGAWQIKTNGRVILEPLGWFDERARKRGEERLNSMLYYTPQDSAGNAISVIYLEDPDKPNQSLLYFNQIRRLRKLSSDDTQDPFPGADHTMDDSEGFSQKLGTRFPYKYEVIAEREYLVPSYTWDGSIFFTSKNGVEMRNAEFERRPVYVVQLNSLDPNYIYSKRIMYIDKETFLLLFIENYDRKGRLYRTNESIWAFFPEQGMFSWYNNLGKDHIDVHSTLSNFWFNPFAYWISRSEAEGIGQLMKKGK